MFDRDKYAKLVDQVANSLGLALDRFPDDEDGIVGIDIKELSIALDRVLIVYGNMLGINLAEASMTDPPNNKPKKDEYPGSKLN